MPAATVHLDDLDDPRLAIYRSLKATNATRRSNLFVVEGRKLAERLWRSRFPTESVLVSDRLAPEVSALVPDGIPVLSLPQPSLEALVGYNFHQGVLACGRRVGWPGLRELVGPPGTRATLVVCPRIDNPENLGSIIRIADVFGATAVVTGPRRPDPLSRRVLRVSMGTALDLPVVSPPDLASELERLRAEDDFQLLATDCSPESDPFDRLDPPGRLALLLGSEGNGLDRDWFDICDRRITIPMRAGAESLNVSVAAGILLYHLTRVPVGDRRDPHPGRSPPANPETIG